MKGFMTVIWGILLIASVVSCANRRKLNELSNANIGIKVAMANDTVTLASVRDSVLEQKPQDRIAVVDIQGKVLIMDAVKDEESGEMIAMDRLQAVVVEAKFRNVPERNGYVNIAFDVTVPQAMQSSDWQVRLAPRLYFLGDTMLLDKIYVTGRNYRASQMRGYELYNKFLNSIIPDSCNFIDVFTRRNLLEIFIERNFKELAALKNDSTIVDSLQIVNMFGVSWQDAVDHYTKNFLVRRNNRRIGNKEKMFGKYVKAPIEKSNIRLDSVITSPNGTIKYCYIQSIKTRKGLRKVDLVIDGAIYKENRLLYSIPPADTLTYYISSMTFFADNTPRYLKKIIERNAVANTSAYIDFKPGDYSLCDTLHENATEIRRIRNNVRELLSNKDYIVDSLLITASCSPEGSYALNTRLAKARANSIKEYFNAYIKSYRDSVASSVWSIDVTGNSLSGGETGSVESGEGNSLDLASLQSFIKTKSIAEYWVKLQNLIRNDANITDIEGAERCFLVEDPDARERALTKHPDYVYMRSVLYPLLRSVKFDFYLHRKGMIKDTVHTTEIDSLYMRGVEALSNRDYQTAVTLLRPYNDINSAVAYVCMDYNNSALMVLDSLPKSAVRDYMLAVVNSRLGNEQKAVEYFMHAVEQDYSMRHRGNLDPEIWGLIKKYNMNPLLDNF